MGIDEMEGLPERPASVADWEDLLVRLEIVPRVVRNVVDEMAIAAPSVRMLAKAVDREEAVGRWLEAAARVDEPGSRRGDSAVAADAGGLALRFASLRARTFAMVQRRGLEVWLWKGPLGDSESVTVHQVLLWLAGQDAALLSDLRQVARVGSA